MTGTHRTAEISKQAVIGQNTRVWAGVQIRDHARVGRNCILGKGVFVDSYVTLGDNVKVQNNASLYQGLTVEDGVFVGPHVVFTNDRTPRAINPDGSLKTTDDWVLGTTIVRYGAAIGACTVVVTGVEIGRWAMIGSGAVITKNVPDYALVVGSPGRVVGYVSASGVRCVTSAEAEALTAAEVSR